MGKKKRSIRQSGVIPLLYDWPNLHAVLITARCAPDRWIVPKGNVPRSLGAPESAAREAFEEAGISGRVLPTPIGSWSYVKRGAAHEVALYVLRVDRVHAEWPEMRVRRRSFVSLDRADKLLAPDVLRRVFRDLGQRKRWIGR